MLACHCLSEGYRLLHVLLTLSLSRFLSPPSLSPSVFPSLSHTLTHSLPPSFFSSFSLCIPGHRIPQRAAEQDIQHQTRADPAHYRSAGHTCLARHCWLPPIFRGPKTRARARALSPLCRIIDQKSTLVGKALLPLSFLPRCAC